MNNFHFLTVSCTHFQKQAFADVLLSAIKISQYSELKRDSNRGVCL